MVYEFVRWYLFDLVIVNIYVLFIIVCSFYVNSFLIICNNLFNNMLFYYILYIMIINLYFYYVLVIWYYIFWYIKWLFVIDILIVGFFKCIDCFFVEKSYLKKISYSFYDDRVILEKFD